MKSPSHLFENLIRFLSKNVFPDATSGGPVTSYAHQILCLDSLLLYLKHIVDRITPIVSKSTESSLLMENKRRKRILMECADKFNEKPKEGIIMLQENGFLPTPVDPESLAKILKYTPRINKTLLGDYISKPVNIEILKSFISDFDFVGVSAFNIETYRRSSSVIT